jgi:hypothetical protein
MWPHENVKMTSRFTLDKFASPLFNGQRPSVWGLNLNVFPMESEELREPYMAWREKAIKIMAGTGAYIYPFEHIHVTAASPAPFQHPEHSAWSETEKTDYAIAWIEALKACCASYAAPSTENISNAEQDSSQWPPQPFPLIFDSMELHSSCGIFLLLDPTGSVSGIRSCISRALKHEALSTGKGPGLLAQSGFKIPNIIHCTVMRLAVDRADGMTEEELEARWERAASEWTPTKVLAGRMILVQEHVAYQHNRPSEGLLAEFPYAPYVANRSHPFPQ